MKTMSSPASVICPIYLPRPRAKSNLRALKRDEKKHIVDDLIKKAVRKVFNRNLKVDTFRKFIERFKGGCGASRCPT